MLFDFDGTLTAPGALDFSRIRSAIGCPEHEPILEFIAGLPGPAVRDEAVRTLDRYEMEAAVRSHPNAGAEEVVRTLLGWGLRVGIISRNSSQAIRLALERFRRTGPSDFHVILSRDDPPAPKPSPESILLAADRLGIPPHQVLVVGDYVYDIEAGRQAGAWTAYLTNRSRPGASQPAPDFTIDALEELLPIVDLLRPLPMGKLPNRMLEGFLRDLAPGRSETLLVAPSVGEDFAAVTLEGEEVLVLKSDPVTFATDAPGHYAVLVNANDIATSGARPRWFLASLLFPPGTTAGEIRDVMGEIDRMARRAGMILCGGHTEVTDAVTRPVAAGQVIGTVSRGRLIDKRAMSAGDRLVMTKRVAVEGTSILARRHPEALAARGVTREEIARAQDFLTDPGIGILREAGAAAAVDGITAMHDVTEGGLATAVTELSVAGGHRIRVAVDRIPHYEETRKICRALAIDPLGLIGSGTLLITCRPGSLERLVGAVEASGIESTLIGEVLEAGSGVEAVDTASGRSAAWPSFDVDELARLLEGNGLDR